MDWVPHLVFMAGNCCTMVVFTMICEALESYLPQKCSCLDQQDHQAERRESMYT